MATIAPVSVPPAAAPWADTRVTMVLLAVLALALRFPDLGNPLLDVDEPLYRYIGSRMADGAIPYVDVWDRKPVGLFLIYWLIDRLGGDPFVTGQAVALAFAFVTAATIAAMARRLAGGGAGLAAGAIYLVWIALLGGRSGQSPVFYNLPVALAAWTVMTAWRVPEAHRAWRLGLVAMLLVGTALQIKPTAVFEGVGLGLALLVARYRHNPAWPRLAGHAALLIGAALLPTALAFAAYAAMGHGQAWWFANVESIFLRAAVPGEPVFARLPGHALALAAPAVAAIAGLLRLEPGDRIGPGLWLFAAMLGALAVPPYYNHYMLPLVVPLALLAGVGVARSRVVAVTVVLCGAALLLLMGLPSLDVTIAARAKVARLTAAVSAHAHGGCAFAFNAPPLLNLTSGTCTPTRYAFGLHLSSIREAKAIGVDPVAEVRRILADRPPVIVTGQAAADRYAPTHRLIAAALARDYAPVAGDAGYTVYARRSVGE